MELNAQLVPTRRTEKTISETPANRQTTATLHSLKHATNFIDAAGDVTPTESRESTKRDKLKLPQTRLKIVTSTL